MNCSEPRKLLFVSGEVCRARPKAANPAIGAVAVDGDSGGLSGFRYTEQGDSFEQRWVL
jgi:hypothetical protein